MQILILGKSYPAKRLAEHLAQNKSNIIFAPFEAESVTTVELNEDELFDFISANEIKLLIVADRDLISNDYEELLAETNCKIFCPDLNAKKLCQAISSGKKFAYKNKIQTSKFALFDKLQTALEYIQTADYPINIMPDIPNHIEAQFIAETKSKAKNKLENLFLTGNKKVLIENYVSPLEYTKYIISDSTGAMGLFGTVSYFEETNTNYIEKLNPDTLKQIETELIPNILDGIIEEGIYYKGILGISFKIDSKNEIYFSRFTPFFNELDIDIALNSIDEELGDLFYFCAKDDMLNEYEEIKVNNSYTITQNINNEIIQGSSYTFNKAIDKLIVEGADMETIDEALKIWGIQQ